MQETLTHGGYHASNQPLNQNIMVLLKEDLKSIGHTAYCDLDENTIIVSDGKYLGIERIIIRNVLLQFGDYTIIEEGDVLNTDGTCDWEFVTDFPWSEFCKL